MKLRLLLVFGAACIVAAVVTFLRVESGPASSGADVSGIGKTNVPVPTSVAVKASGVGAMHLIAKANGTVFYRASRDGRQCLGGGDEATLGRPAFMICGLDGGNFPSTANPVIAVPDLSTTRDNPNDWKLNRVDGFAADAVARVTLTNGAGEVIAEGLVVNNVFSLVPPDGPTSAGEVRAYDKTGNKVYSRSYRRTSR